MNKYLFLFTFLITTISNLHSQCWKKIESGNSHVVAIANDNTLWSWGSNSFGKLGIASTSTTQNTPQQVGNSNNWKEVSAGSDHTLAIKEDGTLWAWGRNNSFQLGLGSSPQSINTPTQVGNENNWSKVFAGYETSFAIKTNGTLWAWGKNNLSQLGNGMATVVSEPQQIGTSNSWKEIASGFENFTIGLKLDGTLWSWGFNVAGQLGLGDNSNRTIPTQIGNLTNWTKITTTQITGLALNNQGQIYFFGQALGSNNYYNSPTLLGTESDWISIDGGWNHATAIKQNNSIWAWGNNQDFQLCSNLASNEESLPIQTNFTNNSGLQISNGQNFSLAILQYNQLKSIGINQFGNLGNGEYNTTTTGLLYTINCPSSLNTNIYEVSNEFVISPNPCKSHFVVSNSEKVKSISILDIQGKKVLETENFNGVINTNDLTNGIYFVKIETNDYHNKTMKLIKI